MIDIRQSSPYFTKKPKHLARDLEQYLAWVDKYALVPDAARQIAYIDDKIERRHRDVYKRQVQDHFLIADCFSCHTIDFDF